MPKSKQTRARKRSAKGHDEKASKAQKVSSTPLSETAKDAPNAMSAESTTACSQITIGEEDEYKDELALVDMYVRENEYNVLSLAKARKHATRGLSNVLAAFISATIDVLDHSGTKSSNVINGEVSTLFNKLSFADKERLWHGPVTRSRSQGKSVSIPGMSGFIKEVRPLHRRFRSWIPTEGKSTIDSKERNDYPCILDIVTFVAHCLNLCRTSAKSPSTFPSDFNVILPCANSSTETPDTYDDTHTGIGLTGECVEDIEQDGIRSWRAGYTFLFAIIEERPTNSSHDVRMAFARLLRHTIKIYKCQANRRFAWGLTVCGSDVRICHLSNDVAFASPPLNLSESDGFGKFISILVDWSLCDNDQRGYDPSMDSADEHGGWLIQCADVETGETNVYVSTAELASSDRLFGRHTRCFIAKQQIRGADGSTSYGPPVVVKDSWPSKLTDSALDETELLRMINDKLPKHAEGVMYPKLLACECVAFNYSSTGDVSNDTTTSILGNLHDDEDSEVSEDKHYIWFRGHKRYVTSPVGERLGTARSFDELAAAMADVMKTHEMARKHCDILHRDISHNNMMIVREKDHVRGLLIDYDASITQSELKEQSAPGRVGTFYCMSIGNLQNNTVPRTALDDWESLLYVICHYATTGVGSGRIVNWDEPAKRPIKKWVADSHDDAALFKKQHLASEKAFKDNITSHFRKTDKGGEKMVALAKSLHTMLFFNPRLNWICHGVDKRWGIIDGKRVYRDPFEARTENVDGIVNDLLAVMGQAQNSDIGGTSA